MPDKKNIGVIFGGRSVEHEVSVITAHQIMDAIKAAGFDVLPIYITKEGHWYAGAPLYNLKAYSQAVFSPANLEGAYPVTLSPDRSVRQLLINPAHKKSMFGKLPALWADVFFPAVHGSFGEDGTLQGLLEMADVAYTGSGVLASAIAIDKVRTKEALRAAGLPVLDCLWFHRQAWTEDSDFVLAKAEQFSSYPLIVKPVSLGSSIGVKRCNDRQSLSEAMELAFELDSRVLVERALVDFFEINCSVMGPPERPSVCEQPAATEQVLTFEAKYKRGGKAGKSGGSKGSGTGMASLDRIIPAPIPQDLTAKIQQSAVQAFQAIGAAGVARIDFLVDKSGLYVNEINTLPGSLAFYLWEHTGIHFDQLVTMMISSAEERYRARRRTQFSFDANLLVKR